MKRLALLFFALFLATPLAYAMEAEWEGYGAFGDVEAFYHTESWNDFHAQKIPSDFANLLLWINNLQEFIERGNVSAKAFYQSKKSYIDTMTAQPGFEPQQIRFREVAGEIESFLSKKHLSSLPKAGGYVPPPPPPPMYGYGVGFGGVLPPVAILKPDQLPSGRPPAPSLPKQVLGAGLGGMHMPPVTVVTPPPYPFPGYGHGTGFGGGMPKPPVTFFSPPAVVPDLPADLVLEGKIQKFIDGGMIPNVGQRLEGGPRKFLTTTTGEQFARYRNGADGDCGLFVLGLDPSTVRGRDLSQLKIPAIRTDAFEIEPDTVREIIFGDEALSQEFKRKKGSIDYNLLACIAYNFGKNLRIWNEAGELLAETIKYGGPVLDVVMAGIGHFERLVPVGDILERIRARTIEDETTKQLDSVAHGDDTGYIRAQSISLDQALGEFARAYAEVVPNVRQVAVHMAALRGYDGGYAVAHMPLPSDSSDDEDAPHGSAKGSSYHGSVQPPRLTRGPAMGGDWDGDQPWDDDSIGSAVPLYKPGFGPGTMMGYGAGGHGMHPGVGFGTGYSATGGGYGGMPPHNKPTAAAKPKYDLSKALLGESDEFDRYVDMYGVPGQLGYPPHVPPATSGGGYPPHVLPAPPAGYPPFSAKGHGAGGYGGEAYTSSGFVDVSVVGTEPAAVSPFRDRILDGLGTYNTTNWQSFYGKLFQDNGAVQPERAFLIGHNHSLFHPKNGASTGQNAMTALLNECQRKRLTTNIYGNNEKTITVCALDAVSIMADSFGYAGKNHMYACSNDAEDEGLAKTVTGILFTGGEFGVRQKEATHDEFEQILDALYQTTNYMTLDDIYRAMTPGTANARLRQHQHNMFLCAAMMWGQNHKDQGPFASISFIGNKLGVNGDFEGMRQVMNELQALQGRFGSIGLLTLEQRRDVEELLQ